MIRHTVFFSAKDPADIETIRDGLMILADIPHSDHFEVGRNLNTDPLAEAHVDLVVYAEFKDAAALAAYKAHPLYQKSINVVKPLRDRRFAADFPA
ncbi:MAG: Dabb family protein [Paracoccaceae bacterium]